jgi:MoaA/NifB/PqqE/SkfB family radical SAM enzyme
MKRLYFASLNDCNEYCLFCVRRGDQAPIEFIGTEKAKQILARKKEEGYTEIYFDGGEPTLRGDLVELVQFIKDKKFKVVNILTNAVLLSDSKLTQKILSVKNTKDFTLSFSVSLHSHKKNISEKLVNQKNTFEKTIKGIKNLIKNGCRNVSIYHIITKYNYRDLPAFVDFIHKKFPQIKNITFSFLYPAGAALKNKHIFPQLSKTEPYFQRALSLTKKYNIDFSISTCGTIPLCFLEGYEDILLKQQELDQPEKVGLVDASRDVQYQLASKEFHQKTKIKASWCNDCFYNDKCGGIWKNYVEMYGINELKPIRKNQSSQGNVLLVVTGWSCNNNCLLCSTVANRSVNRKTGEIIADLKKGFEKGYRIIEFIGGEVSIRPDFLFLVSSAKKIGFNDIRLTTNGRRFSYSDFIQKAVEAGLKVAAFSLYGHNGTLHNGVTRTPGSFKQCVQGIKNALTYPELEVIVNTVVSKFNYQSLEQIAQFLRNLGIKEWHLLELLPDGRAEKIYDKISVNYQTLSPYLNKALKQSKYFKKIDVFDFPFCLFEPEIFKIGNIVFFTPRHRFEDISQVGFKPVRVKKKKIDGQVIYQDKYKLKPAICQKCRYFHECGGLSKPYFKKYQDKEIKKLAAKYRFIV